MRDRIAVLEGKVRWLFLELIWMNEEPQVSTKKERQARLKRVMRSFETIPVPPSSETGNETTCESIDKGKGGGKGSPLDRDTSDIGSRPRGRDSSWGSDKSSPASSVRTVRGGSQGADVGDSAVATDMVGGDGAGDVGAEPGATGLLRADDSGASAERAPNGAKPDSYRKYQREYKRKKRAES